MSDKTGALTRGAISFARVLVALYTGKRHTRFCAEGLHVTPSGKTLLAWTYPHKFRVALAQVLHNFAYDLRQVGETLPPHKERDGFSTGFIIWAVCIFGATMPAALRPPNWQRHVTYVACAIGLFVVIIATMYAFAGLALASSRALRRLTHRLFTKIDPSLWAEEGEPAWDLLIKELRRRVNTPFIPGDIADRLGESTHKLIRSYLQNIQDVRAKRGDVQAEGIIHVAAIETAEKLAAAYNKTLRARPPEV